MSYEFKTVELVGVNNFVSLKIEGKLTVEDYNFFVPTIDEQIRLYGKINMLVELVDFHGWTAGAAWEDAKFGLKHFSDIECLAVVGDKSWEKGMTYFVKPFTKAKVRYFDVLEKTEALRWLGVS